MIVVDSSALIAIIENEPEKQAFQSIIVNEDRCLVSAVNVHETGVVLRVRHGPSAVGRLWAYLDTNEVEVIPFERPQLFAALAAYGRFGKGIHSRARLNLCDCAAYGLATTMNVPLLFKGNDFKETDVQRRI